MKYDNSNIKQSVIDSLKKRYGITIKSLDFKPVGEESYSYLAIDSKDGLKLADWDGAMIVPSERDLNFLLGNPHFSVDEYLKKMRKENYDPKLKEYYRH